VLFGIASASWTRLRTRPGLTLLLYISLYAGTRFFLEFVRGDQVRYTALHWSVPQFMSVAALALCLVIVAASRRACPPSRPEPSATPGESPQDSRWC